MQLIACGAPTLYQSNERRYVLQEGCSCLPLVKKNDHIPSFELTETQFHNHVKEAEGQLSLPVTAISELICLTPNMACVIKLYPSNAIIPARIVQVNSMMELVTIELTGRSQIIKREIAMIQGDT